MLKFEDRGIDTIFIKNSDGIRIAAKTSIQRLFDQVIHKVNKNLKSLSFQISFLEILFAGIFQTELFFVFNRHLINLILESAF